MVSRTALVLLLSSAVTVAAQQQPVQHGRTVAVSPERNRCPARSGSD